MDLLGTTRTESEEAVMNEAGSAQLNDRERITDGSDWFDEITPIIRQKMLG